MTKQNVDEKFLDSKLRDYETLLSEYNNILEKKRQLENELAESKKQIEKLKIRIKELKEANKRNFDVPDYLIEEQVKWYLENEDDEI